MNGVHRQTTEFLHFDNPALAPVQQFFTQFHTEKIMKKTIY